MTNLSTSDSGVLVRIAKNASASDTSSQIDLESEIARRSQSRSGHSSAHGGSTVVRTTPAAPLPGQPVAPMPAPLPAATGPRVLWVIGLAIMFVIAVLLGVLIARLTA